MNRIDLEKITGIALFLVGFLLPISTAFSNIALGLLLATTVWSYTTLGIDSTNLRDKRFYLYSPLLFFILIFGGFFYSPMDYEALKEVKRTLFMLVLPTLLLRRDLVFPKALKQGASGLVLGSLVSALILLVFNSIGIFSEDLSWRRAFGYDHTSFNFTEPLGIHPIYLGSYYFMALVFIFYNKIQVKRHWAIAGTVILALGILFLNSRIIFGLTAVMSLFFLIRNVSWKVIVPLLLGCIISGVLLFPKIKHTYLVDKLISGTQWELSDNVGTYNTDDKHPADSRFSRWKIAGQLIAERPLVGSGTGTERPQLGEKFKENQMKVSYESRYNAHNQFIGFTIRFGLIGLAFVLLYFTGNGILSIQQKEWDFLWFVFLIIGISLIENYLDRNMGINFLAFFGTLFWGNVLRKENHPKIHSDFP